MYLPCAYMCNGMAVLVCLGIGVVLGESAGVAHGQVKQLYAEGIREVTLLGQNVNSYADTSLRGQDSSSDAAPSTSYYAQVPCCSERSVELSGVLMHVLSPVPSLPSRWLRLACAGLQLAVQAAESPGRRGAVC